MTTLSPEALLVRAALEAQGLETPLVTNELNSQQKREKIRRPYALHHGDTGAGSDR